MIGECYHRTYLMRLVLGPFLRGTIHGTGRSQLRDSGEPRGESSVVAGAWPRAQIPGLLPGPQSDASNNTTKRRAEGGENLGQNKRRSTAEPPRKRA